MKLGILALVAVVAATSPGGRSMTHPVKAGDMHRVDGAVTHTLFNDGRENGVLVEFELK
jgi:hypothetical protein